MLGVDSSYLRDTQAFTEKSQELGHFAVKETGWPKLDPFMRVHGPPEPPPVREQPVILYHSTFSPSWSAAPILYENIREMSRSGRWRSPCGSPRTPWCPS